MNNRSSSEGSGCLIVILAFICFFVGMGILGLVIDSQEHDEQIKRIEESVNIDGIYYQQQDDHMVVIGLADPTILSISIPDKGGMI